MSRRVRRPIESTLRPAPRKYDRSGLWGYDVCFDIPEDRISSITSGTCVFQNTDIPRLSRPIVSIDDCQARWRKLELLISGKRVDAGWIYDFEKRDGLRVIRLV